jgi:hypothetical protein
MSEHAWTQENVAAYVAGGLDAEEGQRIERHVAECAECAAALGACRGLDRSLETLFADARPAAGLEERAVAALRKASLSPWARMSWGQKLAWGTAATVAIGLTGAGASHVMNGGVILFPGWGSNEQLQANNDLKPKFGMPSDPRIDNYTKPNLAVMAREGSELEGATNFDTPRIAEVSTPGEMAGEISKSSAIDEASVRERMKQYHALQDGNSAAVTYAGRPESGALRIQNASNNNGNNNGFGGGAMGLGGGMGGIGGGGLGGLGGGGMMPGGTNPQSAKGQGVGAPNARNEATTKEQELQVSNGDWKSVEPLDKRGYKVPPAPTVSADDNSKAEKPPQTVLYFHPSEHQAKWQKDGEGKEDGGKNKESGAGEGKARAPQAGFGPGQGSGPGKSDPKPTQPAPEQNAPRRIIIRSGEIEFEIESFDSAAATVTKLVMGIKGAFVSTVNSDKLPNGKVKGSMVVRVPPESLDGFVLDLRRELGKGGELKGLKIGSQDITKQYTDLESRLKAAKTMQDRLLQIIKDGKGEIKQLLEAEKELGVWRTKIEELEGEIRYYANLAALSTLTITLAEKEIRAAVELVEREQVQAGVEVEDVDKAREELLKEVAEHKGRVVKAELKQPSVGQFNATLNFEVPPAAAGPIQDRLRQIGTVVRFDKERVVQAEGGQATRDSKVRRGDAIFLVQLYNVTNMAARETTTVQLAVADVPKSYQTLQQAVEKARGRVVTGQLNENDRQNITAQLDFEVRRGQEPALQTALAAAGEIIGRQTTRAVASENTTDAKVAYRATLFNVAKIPPREVVTLGIEVTDVDRELDTIRAMVNEAKGHTVDSVVGHERNGKVTARVLYDVPLAAAPELVEKFKRLGVVRAQQSIRNQQAPEGSFAIARLDVTISNTESIVPKDDGLWKQVHTGLSYSARGLLVSLSWLIVGLCVVLPWGLVAYGVYRMARRLFRTAPVS